MIARVPITAIEVGHGWRWSRPSMQTATELDLDDLDGLRLEAKFLDDDKAVNIEMDGPVIIEQAATRLVVRGELDCETNSRVYWGPWKYMPTSGVIIYQGNRVIGDGVFGKTRFLGKGDRLIVTVTFRW